MLAKRLVAAVRIGERPSTPEERPADPHDVSRHPAYAQAADEVLLIASEGGTEDVIQRLRELSGLAFVPVAVMPRSLSATELEELMEAGADRVYVWARQADELVAAAVARWGTEAVGVAVALQAPVGLVDWRLTTSEQATSAAIGLQDASTIVPPGAGELLVIVPRADLGDCAEALRALSDQIDVPIIVSGTARTTEGLRRVLIEGGVGGLVFEPNCIEEFEDVAQIKTYLAAAGIVVRGA